MKTAMNLFIAATTFLASSLALAADAASEMVVIDPGKATFETPHGMPDCARMTVLKGDPSKGPALILARMTGPCTIPWHWHTPTETLMVVGGIGKLEMKDSKPIPFKPGAYLALPSHHVHQASCMALSKCEMFISADAAFDIHYVDDKGAEITPDQALKKKSKAKD